MNSGEYLMPTEFKYLTHKTAPEALVVHCSDAGFQTTFRRFRVEELGLADYISFGSGRRALRSGCQWQFSGGLSHPVLANQIPHRIGPLKSAILINHQDCRWYRGHGDLSALDADTRAQADLETSKGILSAGLPGVEVRAFWAGLDGSTVTFSEVDEPARLGSADLSREPKPWLA